MGRTEVGGALMTIYSSGRCLVMTASSSNAFPSLSPTASLKETSIFFKEIFNVGI